MIRRRSVVRCYSLIRGAGAAAKARWESAAAPAPVETHGEFLDRLDTIERKLNRVLPFSAFVAALAGVAVAYNWSWLT